MCGVVVLSYALFREFLCHCHNVSSLSLFYRCYIGRCSFALGHLVSLIFVGNILFTKILTCYNDAFDKSSLNSLLAECFHLSYDANCFKLRVSRHPRKSLKIQERV